MSLFQKSVITKQLQSQNKSKLDLQWIVYKNHFHNPHIQENIRNSKEEQYQGEFLIDLFVNVLGYVKNPNPNYTLTTEYKNVKDSKKADGAILVNDKVSAVIELKGTNTTDLGKIEVQAFGYKNNQPDCVYVITSNFEKLRFYIDNATEFLEFNLFQLTEKEFELLYLCLAYDNVSTDVPKKLKEQSLSKEKDITKALYTDYSQFKRELHQDLVKQNPNFDALELFKKSQKLLDRFLFLFFAEDRQLLPPNSVRLILQQWEKLRELDEYVPLYARFKKYFGYLNTGFKGKQHDVFAYNGGLFKPDEVLDAIIINDELLYKHTLKLSEYDFASEVDVNILGHIFENSLNELDEIKAQLEGTVIEKATTKRKKDGVFYTPKYITKYIVDNTIGKLCADKKAEFKILEEDYFTDKKRTKAIKQSLLEKLNDYRNWLLKITICDPACGSGAFLNQALDFLIAEHKYLDELQAKLFGDALVLSDIEKSILENNLFGVDLNEESVEIAKLSLWLRTAQPNRKLNDLNNNIKCGNSLIDDVAIAGEKAFNWQKSFPKIFLEKDKKAWHITTAIHDSRTSQRMIDYKVREKRAMGAMPMPNIIPLTAEEETIIVKIVSEIVIEDKLAVMAFNVCRDHIHLVLVCEEEVLTKVVQKIKSKTARAVNIDIGSTVIATMEHAPLADVSPLSENALSMEHAPLANARGEKQNSLWTQKFGCKEITDDKQLWNTVEYVRNNRSKHNLPALEILQQPSIIKCFYQGYEDVFKTEYKGGFDVIIGNPPYVRSRELFNDVEKKYFLENFETTSYQLDLYKLFIEKSTKLINENGLLSFITPSVFLINEYDKPLRKYLLDRFSLMKVVNSDENIFEDASVKTVIFLIGKNFYSNNIVEFLNVVKSDFRPVKSIEQIVFIQEDYLINEKLNLSSISILDKLRRFKTLENFYDVKNGMKVRKELLFEKETDKYFKPFILGKNIFPYFNSYDGLFVDYKIENEKLYTNQAFRSEDIFTRKKLIVRQILGKRIITSYDEEHFFTDQTTYLVLESDSKLDLKYVLALLNSKLMYYFFTNTSSDNKIVFPKVKKSQLLELPVAISENMDLFIEKATTMLSLNKDLQEQSQKFQRSIQRKFNLEALPKKLQDWYLLTYSEFIAELTKQKIKLSLSQEAEWEDYFTTEAEKVLALKAEIDKTDKDIDVMVYKLYDLTPEEIAIVENS